MRISKRLLSAAAAIGIAGSCAIPIPASGQDAGNDITERISAYNVVFDSKGSSSKDSMPIGNGDIAANVWVEDNGDLMMYLAKGDTFSEATRLLKLGKLRIKITPNPFESSKAFRQELNLTDGAIYVTAGEGADEVRLKLWADANNPVIHAEAESDSEISIEVKAEPWRTTELKMNSTNTRSYIGVQTAKETPSESADVYLDRDDSITWYHRNSTSLYNEMLEYQGLDGYEERYPDPYLNSTFGARVAGDNMQSSDEYTLSSVSGSNNFDLQITAYTEQTETVEEWEEKLLESLSANYNTEAAFSEHCRYWNEFWNKSWIFVSGDSDAEALTRGYLLQRYMSACQGRSSFPIKFNGGLFTMPDAKYGDDYRDWGSMYWHQNTRLVYWPMLAAGDFYLMMPYFKMYKDQLPIRKEIAEQFFGCSGAYYPEQVFAYGADGTRDKMKWAIEGTADYTTYHWQNGFEITAMMLDYYDYTNDDDFAREYLVPIAQEVIRFYNEMYTKDGVMTITPSNALETYWNCTNPTDHIAGLSYIIPRLIELPDTLTTPELISEWESCLSALPELPMSEDGTYIKPAESYGGTKNTENPELYAVFPYKLYAIGSDTDINIGIKTFEQRKYKYVDRGCWYQDGIHAAVLGLTDTAKKNALHGLTNTASGCKFPGLWAKGNDEVPDFDNGGQAALTLQNMLMQCSNGKIYILPAWPEEWNVDFKLNGYNNTSVHVIYENGEITSCESSVPDQAIVFPTKEYEFTTAPTDHELVLDDNADGSTISEWNGSISAGTDNGRTIYTISAPLDTSSIASTGDPVNDCTVTAVMRMAEIKKYFGGGLIFRHADDSNYATFRLSGTGSTDMSAELIKFENGKSTKLAAQPYIFDTNTYYTLKVNVSGNSVTAFINDVPVFENIDIGTTLKSGNIGARVYAGTIYLDSISAECVSDETYISSGTVKGDAVKASIANNGDAKECRVVCALYDSGRLEKLDVKEYTLEKNSVTDAALNVEAPLDTENRTMKIMVLDGNDTLTPLCPAAVCYFKDSPAETPAPTAGVSAPPAASQTPAVEIPGGSALADMLSCSYSSDVSPHALNYRLYVPESYDSSKKYPLLVYLNGAGSRGNDNTAQLSNLAPMLNPIMSNEEEYPCIIAVPQCPSNEQWVDTPWQAGSYSIDKVAESDELKLVRGMIDELCGKYNVDTNRLYLSGQSMGGYGCWDMLIRYPELFAAAVINCGAGDPSKAELIKDIPITVLHGNADPTVPVSGSIDMVNALKECGGNVKYLEFDSCDHYVQRRMFENPSLWLNDLFSKTKSDTPISQKAPYREYELVSCEQFGDRIPERYSTNQSSAWSFSQTGEGMLMGTSGKDSGAVIYDSSTLNMSDYTVSAYIKTADKSDGGAGIVVRYKNDSTLITVRFVGGSSTRLQVVELQSGANNVTKDYPFDWSYNTLYNLKVEVKGGTLSAYVDNVPVITDYSIYRSSLKDTGAAGLRVYNGTVYADDLAIYTEKAVSISSPENGTTVLSPYIPLSGYTSSAGADFDLYIDGKKTETISGSNAGWSFKTSRLENGAHTVSVNEKGSDKASDTHTIYVNNQYSAAVTEYSASFSLINGTAENFTDSRINAAVKAEHVIGNDTTDTVTDQITLEPNSAADFTLPIDWDLSTGYVRLYITNESGDTISYITEIPPQEPIFVSNGFENYQVLQRDIGGDSRTVTISGIYDGLSADIETRIVSADNGDEVVPWTVAEQNGTDFSGELTIPQGGWYRLELRAVKDGDTINELKPENKFGVLCIGQSNMVGTGALASNTSANTDGRTSYTEANDLAANFSNGTWKHLKDPYDDNAGSMIPSLANALTEKYEIPIGFVPAAASGAGLAVDPDNKWPNWITRFDDDHYKYDPLNIYGRSLQRAEAAGGIELIIMNQGEHDVSMGTDPAVYEQMMNELYGYYNEDLYENIPLFICQLGASASPIDAYKGKDDIMTGIRTAQDRCDNGSTIFMAATETDLSKNKDEIHFTVSSLDIIGQRMANAIMYYYGDSDYYRGAYISSAEFAEGGNAIDVHITHRGGTDFTPESDITGFTVYDDGKEVEVISAEKTSSETIRLTLEQPITGIGTLRYLYGKTPDISGMIKDNTPLALPMEGTTDDILIQ